jgi:hypothetical protein
MKPEPFFDRDSSANLIGQAKANRAKYLRDMFSSYSSKKLARAVAFIGLISLVAVGLPLGGDASLLQLWVTAIFLCTNARNDEIRDNVTRMRCQWEEERDALATVRRFNAPCRPRAIRGSGRRSKPRSFPSTIGGSLPATVATAWSI